MLVVIPYNDEHWKKLPQLIFEYLFQGRDRGNKAEEDIHAQGTGDCPAAHQKSGIHVSSFKT